MGGRYIFFLPTFFLEIAEFNEILLAAPAFPLKVEEASLQILNLN